MCSTFKCQLKTNQVNSAELLTSSEKLLIPKYFKNHLLKLSTRCCERQERRKSGFVVFQVTFTSTPELLKVAYQYTFEYFNYTLQKILQSHLTKSAICVLHFST